MRIHWNMEDKSLIIKRCSFNHYRNRYSKQICYFLCFNRFITSTQIGLTFLGEFIFLVILFILDLIELPVFFCLICLIFLLALSVFSDKTHELIHSMIFFVQTALSLKLLDPLLPTFERFSNFLHIANLQVYGFECSLPSVAPGSLEKFLFEMFLPFLAIIGIVLIFVAAKLLQKVFNFGKSKIEEDHRAPVLPADKESLLRSASVNDDSPDPDMRLVLAEDPEALNPSEVRLNSNYNLLRIVLFLLHVAYFGLVEVIFNQFGCTGGSPSYLLRYPWIECTLNDSTYRPVFISAICFGVIYVIGIPLLFIAILQYYKKEIMNHEEPSIWWFEFLFENFKKKFYYFDSLLTLRRAILGFLVTLLGTSLSLI